jgi:hypothetical protein
MLNRGVFDGGRGGQFCSNRAVSVALHRYRQGALKRRPYNFADDVPTVLVVGIIGRYQASEKTKRGSRERPPRLCFPFTPGLELESHADLNLP